MTESIKRMTERKVCIGPMTPNDVLNAYAANPARIRRIIAELEKKEKEKS
jgi:hypothetical protein